ncbi:hypothetical protein CFP75_09665 [Amycolatopsis alba DSM 44262]|uniref:Guanylate cyclase domain-containing protein n=2 Tax=Amycolatopsis alba TaxID=76020 RepID=A0A229S0J3_AMYAL|nr:hypothetical protein CFP75_09665 [Amycolatopsis alba DSM 44262]
MESEKLVFMNQSVPPVTEYRSIVLVDVEGSTKLLEPAQMEARKALYEILDEAFERAGVSEHHQVREDRGDGVMVLVDSAVPKVHLAGTFVGHLVRLLEEHNRSNALSEWLRLRIALHAGEVHRDRHGYGGDALNSAFRLLDADELKERFREVQRAQCVVIASDRLFHDFIRHRPDETGAAHYHEITVARIGKPAWVRVPGFTRLPESPAPEKKTAGPKTSGMTANTLFAGPVTAHRDFVINND